MFSKIHVVHFPVAPKKKSEFTGMITVRALIQLFAGKRISQKKAKELPAANEAVTDSGKTGALFRL